MERIKKRSIGVDRWVPVLGDQNKIFRYDPLRVKELHIINKDYYLGTASTQGIVNFTTYDGRPEGIELDPNTTVIDFEGCNYNENFTIRFMNHRAG
jgi:hypothetical protein